MMINHFVITLLFGFAILTYAVMCIALNIASNILQSRCEEKYNVNQCLEVYLPNTEEELIKEYGAYDNDK